MIVLLNSVFSCSKRFLSFSVDKLTTGGYNLVSVIANVATVGILIAATGGSTLGSVSLIAVSVKAQFSGHVNTRFTLQLIKGMSSVLQKLLRYFNVTENSTSFVFPSLAAFPVILVLYLKDSEFVKGSVEISL